MENESWIRWGWKQENIRSLSLSLSHLQSLPFSLSLFLFHQFFRSSLKQQKYLNNNFDPLAISDHSLTCLSPSHVKSLFLPLPSWSPSLSLFPLSSLSLPPSLSPLSNLWPLFVPGSHFKKWHHQSNFHSLSLSLSLPLSLTLPLSLSLSIPPWLVCWLISNQRPRVFLDTKFEKLSPNREIQKWKFCQHFSLSLLLPLFLSLPLSLSLSFSKSCIIEEDAWQIFRPLSNQ